MSIHEAHKYHRTGWLRAAVLGANDGIVSTASLIVGVAAAQVDKNTILLSGLAGLVAGAMSMAAGEYVSVSSQSDTEKADLLLEKKSLKENPEAEKQELADIYIQRGLTKKLASEVAEQMMANDSLAAHARDEIGIDENSKANPLQAAFTSALTFTVGASLPLLVTWVTPIQSLIFFVSLLSILFLATLGATSAYIGGAPIIKAAIRVSFWGVVAMIITAAVGHLFGISI
jgi:VIT1/CCC1 family predicted Fe2+/Mn2+ transporter